jgi:NAD dependent epimerase/dehydratase
MNLHEKSILVTGADGFIGSHLTEHLVDIGCKVKAFVYYNSFNSWGWLDTLPKETLAAIDVFAGDIRDPNGVRNAMKDIDVVFHLAALIAIPYSYHSPDSYVDTNIRGTLNVLQAARDLGTAKVLATSTSEVYGTATYVPIDEDHPRQGQSPYSATKIGADSLVDSFHRSFGLPVTIVRPFNTYGPRQSARAVIPTVIMQLLSGKGEIELGALEPTRDFVFVSDTVKGFVEIARCDSLVGMDVNIATQTETSIGDMAKTIIRLINPQATIITDRHRLRPSQSEVERLLGSHERLKSHTGWAPQIDLPLGLQQTIEWLRQPANLRHYKTEIYNV